MRIVIAGAGKVGYHLTKILNEEKHLISTIEKEQKLCDKLALEVDSSIICGNATRAEILQDAEIEKADVLIAATGKDEENLLICQMAKLNFNVPKTIARINNPKNEKIFKALGIEYTVSSTTIIASLIEEEAMIKGLRTILALEQGEISLIEYVVDKKAAAVNCKIKNLVLPQECNIAYIIRNKRVVIPRGDIEIKEADHVIALISQKEKKHLEKLLTERTLLKRIGRENYEAQPV